MGSYTLMPLHSFKFKFIGIAISAASIITLLLLKNIDLINFSDAMSSEGQFNLLLWMNCFGLFTIAYSREKHEDERIQMIRDKTFRVSFAFLLSLLMSLSFTSIIFNLDPSMYNIGQVVPIHVTLTLVFHLVLFYIRIYTNRDTTGPELTMMQNISNNRTLFLIYLVVNIVIVLLLIFS